jgi:hypothetical protein
MTTFTKQNIGFGHPFFVRGKGGHWTQVLVFRQDEGEEKAMIGHFTGMAAKIRAAAFVNFQKKVAKTEASRIGLT